MPEVNSRARAEDRRLHDLLAASAAGSRAAFSELYDQLYNPIVRFIYRYTPNTDLIEEILNDTMLVVWQKADSFRGDSRVITWVLGIASRRALKTLRHERTWKAARASLSDNEQSPSDTARLNTLETLDWALAQLRTEQRVVIELAYFHGMSCEEMADILNCPRNTAKTRLYYGRRKLFDILTGSNQPLDFNDLTVESSS